MSNSTGIPGISEALLARYIQRRADDYALCVSALDAQNHEVLERVGHQLKGNGRTFGFPELTELGNTLEIAARSKDWATVQSQLQLFGSWISTHKPT